MHAYTYIQSVPEISAVNWRISAVALNNENSLRKNWEGDSYNRQVFIHIFHSQLRFPSKVFVA
jgi:hypothetical protein